MRATIRIENLTAWRTDQLRAFVQRARAQVYGDELRAVRVRFQRSRRKIHGRANIGGIHSVVWLPGLSSWRGPDRFRLELAQILVHELAHNAGARGERWMRRSSRFGWGDGWEQAVAWALELPLELQPAKPARPESERIALELQRLDKRAVSWERRAKRAATALRSIRRRRAYWNRRMAALDSASRPNRGSEE